MALGILSPSIPSHQQRFPLPLWILECRGRLLEVRPAFADTRFRSKRALDWENFYGYDFHENLEITRDPAGIYSTEVYAARAEQIIRFFDGKPILGRQLCFQVPAQVPQHQLSDVPAVSTPVGTHTAWGPGRVLGYVCRGARPQQKGVQCDGGCHGRDGGEGDWGLEGVRPVWELPGRLCQWQWSSDNAGTVSNLSFQWKSYQGGSNWPLRGEKATVWEGGKGWHPNIQVVKYHGIFSQKVSGPISEEH